MKILALAFLLFATAVHAEDATETAGELMVIPNFASLCGYGMHRNPAGDCISADYQSPECPTIIIGDTTYATHRIDVDTNTFRQCLLIGFRHM